MNQFQDLYKDLVRKIADIEKCRLGEGQKIERCFNTCFLYWFRAVRCIDVDGLDDTCKIRFVKTVRAPIIAAVEYYILRYHALVFEPRDKKKQAAFWRTEGRRLQKFQQQYPVFYAYYKKQATDRDVAYYTRVPKEYFPSCGMITEEALLGKIMALERYMAFVKNKCFPF